MRQRFARAAEGAAGTVLQEKAGGLCLKQAILDGDVVLFDLDADRDQDAAQQIGNLAIQDLLSVFAQLGEQKWQQNSKGETSRLAMVIVDEFPALGGAHLKRLFQRARSRGGVVVLTTQESQALAEVSEAFKAAILTSSNIKIIHQQQENAEEYAKNLGTKKAFKESFQTFENNDLLGVTTSASGQGNLKEVEEFIVHPNVYKKLARGEAIITVGDPNILGEVKISNTSPKITVKLDGVVEETVEFVEVEQESVEQKQQEPLRTEIVVDLTEITAPKRETSPKQKSTKPAAKQSMKESAKSGENFSKFDLLKDETDDGKEAVTVTIRGKFDLLK